MKWLFFITFAILLGIEVKYLHAVTELGWFSILGISLWSPKLAFFVVFLLIHFFRIKKKLFLNWVLSLILILPTERMFLMWLAESRFLEGKPIAMFHFFMELNMIVLTLFIILQAILLQKGINKRLFPQRD